MDCRAMYDRSEDFSSLWPFGGLSGIRELGGHSMMWRCLGCCKNTILYCFSALVGLFSGLRPRRQLYLGADLGICSAQSYSSRSLSDKARICDYIYRCAAAPCQGQELHDAELSGASQPPPISATNGLEADANFADGFAAFEEAPAGFEEAPAAFEEAPAETPADGAHSVAPTAAASSAAAPADFTADFGEDGGNGFADFESAAEQPAAELGLATAGSAAAAEAADDREAEEEAWGFDDEEEESAR
eukprot:1565409-Pleurochrysis_carterae.AAC.2